MQRFTLHHLVRSICLHHKQVYTYRVHVHRGTLERSLTDEQYGASALAGAEMCGKKGRRGQPRNPWLYKPGIYLCRGLCTYPTQSAAVHALIFREFRTRFCPGLTGGFWCGVAHAKHATVHRSI
jgi:hypothetical protein